MIQLINSSKKKQNENQENIQYNQLLKTRSTSNIQNEIHNNTVIVQQQAYMKNYPQQIIGAQHIIKQDILNNQQILQPQIIIKDSQPKFIQQQINNSTLVKLSNTQLQYSNLPSKKLQQDDPQPDIYQQCQHEDDTLNQNLSYVKQLVKNQKSNKSFTSQTKYQKFFDEMKKIQQSNIQYKNQNIELKNQIKQQQQEIYSLEYQNNEQKAEINTLKQEREYQKNTFNDIEYKFRDMELNTNLLSQQIQQLNVLNTQYEQQILALKQENDDIQNKCEQLKEEFKNQTNKQNEQYQNLQQEMIQVNNKNNYMEDTIKENLENIKCLKQDKDNLYKENDIKTLQIKEILIQSQQLSESSIISQGIIEKQSQEIKQLKLLLQEQDCLTKSLQNTELFIHQQMQELIEPNQQPQSSDRESNTTNILDKHFN